MMKLNIKARLRHKTFIISVVSLIVAIISQISKDFFGVDLTDTIAKVWNIFDLILMLLGVLGIVIDPTTAGIGDSEQAMTYEKPKEDKENE